MNTIANFWRALMCVCIFFLLCDWLVTLPFSGRVTGWVFFSVTVLLYAIDRYQKKKSKRFAAKQKQVS
jgi:hypothetical protein